VACDDPAGWRRGARMNLRALAAADSDTPQRQRNCGAVPVGSQVEIRIKDGSAYYCGLETCGNVWLCPVCSAKIRRRRGDELHAAPAIWEGKGHVASRITITVPHDLDDSLSKLVDAERAAWKRVTQGAAWQRLKRRLGIAGHIVALEFTWGDENGWHPHYHVLLVHDQDLDATAIAALHAHIHSRLAESCRDNGLRQPDQLHAVPIDPNISATAAGAYIAKGGDWTPAEEMTRSDLKTSRANSRTPFQILAEYYQTGDTRDRDLWRDYSCVTRRVAAVRWSRSLRAIMLRPAAKPERSDRELATEDRVWIPAVTATDLQGVHFHDLRHAGNNLVAEAGASSARAHGPNGPRQQPRRTYLSALDSRPATCYRRRHSGRGPK
jgi:hypothetical protein